MLAALEDMKQLEPFRMECGFQSVILSGAKDPVAHTGRNGILRLCLRMTKLNNPTQKIKWMALLGRSSSEVQNEKATFLNEGGLFYFELELLSLLITFSPGGRRWPKAG